MHICVPCIHLVPTAFKRALSLNPGPLREQWVLLSAAPALQHVTFNFQSLNKVSFISELCIHVAAFRGPILSSATLILITREEDM